MSAVSSSPRDDSREFQDLPVAFPPLGTANDLEVRRYKKKEVVLRQLILSAFSKKDRVASAALKEFLASRLPPNVNLNADLFSELFQASEPDSTGLISIKAFVETYLQQEKLLESEIDQRANATFEHQKMRTAARAKLDQSKETEKLNKEGIMPDSVLAAKIDHADAALEKVKGKLVAVLSSDSGARVQSNSFTISPQKAINEELQLPIASVSEVITLTLLGQNNGGGSSLIGEGAIKLDRFKDQKKHDDSIEIRNKEGKCVGQLFVNLQWVYSRVKFLVDVVRKWDETIHEDEVAMHELEERIKDLRAPFQSTLEAVVQSVSIQQQIFLTHQMYPEEYDIKECLAFFWYTVGILAIIQMFVKQDFTSLCIGIYGVYLTQTKPPIKPIKLKVMFLSLIGSMIHDTLWMLTLGSTWKYLTATEETPSVYRVADQTLKHIAYTVTVVLLILKAVLIFMMFYVYIQNENLLSKTGLSKHQFVATDADQQRRNIQIVQS